MGFSSSKTKSTSKPVYSGQIEGAAGSLTNAYNANQPQIQDITNQITGLVPGMIQKYQQGDPGIKAAQGYNTDVLSGRYLNANPYLDQVVGQAGNDTRNQSEAALGLKGLTGGSSYADIISRNVGNQANQMRFSNYNSERDRQTQAAGQAPGLAAADLLQIQPLLAVADSANNPLKSAVGYASGMGGLLGQYQNTTSKTSSPWGMILAQALGNAASAFAGG